MTMKKGVDIAGVNNDGGYRRDGHIAGVDKHRVEFCELATLSNMIILSCAWLTLGRPHICYLIYYRVV